LQARYGAASDGSKLYLPRLNARVRKVVNETEVISALADSGFEPFEPEKLSFAEQVARFSACSFAAGSAGAAFANLVFMPQGSRAVILTKDLAQINYWFFHVLAEISGVSLVFVAAEIESDNPSLDIVHQDIRADVGQLTTLIGEMLV